MVYCVLRIWVPTSDAVYDVSAEDKKLTYDLLVKGGRLVDPSQGLDAVRDVAFSRGKVAAVEESLAESSARLTLDATDMIVTPGLLDLHAHAFWGASDYGIEPDIGNIAKGVTTALDAGSSGARTFPAFRRYVMERSDTRLYALLNISAMGMLSPTIGELLDLRWADVEEAVAVGLDNRDLVLGIKARLSERLTGDHDVESLKRALEAAEAIGGFVMIHIGLTKTPLEGLLEMLRPGDAVTHAFHGAKHGVLDDAGRVLEGVREAQQRGVILDIGHGAGGFSFDTGEKALSQGLAPGNISSDLHIRNYDGPVFDHLTVLSKFLWLGMSLYDVVRLSTETTAEVMGVSGWLGTLRVGAEGDATIMRLDEGRFTLTDGARRSVTATQRLAHVHTIKAGRVYNPWLS